MAESHGAAKSGAHTEAEGGAHGGGTFPPFDSSTFASQLVSLVVLFYLSVAGSIWAVAVTCSRRHRSTHTCCGWPARC